MDVGDIVSLVVAAVGFAAIALVVAIWLRGDDQPDRDEAARRYFDLHGRWPGEQ